MFFQVDSVFGQVKKYSGEKANTEKIVSPPTSIEWCHSMLAMLIGLYLASQPG